MAESPTANPNGSIVERIKQQLDIVTEIGATVPLKKSGKAFKGLCPFHGERTPSFYVFPEDNSWKCFGCGEGGDIFTFIEKQQSLDFRETLTLLAERAGIPLDSHWATPDTIESPENTARKRLRALNESAAIWYHHQLLQSPDANYARRYLESRGVNNDTLTHWRLGYAPDGDLLTRYLQEQSYTPKELIEAGLTRERDHSKGGGHYDFFRNRLIFPIRDARGQTIAFGGRELQGGIPKYLNTPQTTLFDKSATLFGLDLARDAIRKANRVVIVEGYMDAILPHQYGYRNVVAVIGSAITDKHIRLIKKLTRRVALALDPDTAGESATLRGISVAQAAFDRIAIPVPTAAPNAPTSRNGQPRGIVRFEEQVDAEMTVVRLPHHEDPDEFVRRDPNGWANAVEHAQPLIEFLIEAQTTDLNLDTPQGKLEASRRLLPIIAEVRDRTLSEDYVGRLATRIRLDKVELSRELALVRQKRDRDARPHPRTDQTSSENTPTQAVERLGDKYQSDGNQSPGASYSSTSAESAPPILGSLMGIAARLRVTHALEDECLGLLLLYPDSWLEVRAILGPADFASAESRALFHTLATTYAELLRNGATLTAHDPAATLRSIPAELQPAAQRATAAQASSETLTGKALLKATRDAAYRLKRTRLSDEMAELDYLERDAKQSGDDDELLLLLKRKLELLSQRRAIEAASGLIG